MSVRVVRWTVTFSDMDELLAAAQRGEVVSEAERQRLLQKQHLQLLPAAAARLGLLHE